MKIVLTNLSIPTLVINQPNVQIQFERVIEPTDEEKKEAEKKKGIPVGQVVTKKIGERATFVLWDEDREELAKELSTKKRYKITIEEV